MENLYSKYRPLNFSDVCGQDKVIKELIKRAGDNNFPQATLLSGTTGTGKTTIANIIAKTLLCKNKDKNNNPCNECPQCQTVIYERPSNYFYMFNASSMNIDDSRGIEELAVTKSLSMNKEKVILIDEFQELSNNKKASKAILKVIEQKLKDTYFILLSMDESKIDKALINRTVPYRLHDLNYEQIAEYLYYICQQENIDLENEEKANVLFTIAENSGGSMRTAISYLERCIYSEIWNVKELIDELKIISTSKLGDIINQLLSGDVNVFKDNTIDKDMLERIRGTLVLFYKFKNGVPLNKYQASQMPKNIIDFDLDVLNHAIESMYELFKFPYISQEMLDFVLINIIRNNKKDDVVKLQENPKRRRPAQ